MIPTFIIKFITREEKCLFERITKYKCDKEISQIF